MSQWNSDFCFPANGQCCYSCFCPQCSTASARNNFDTSNWVFNCLCVTGPVAYNIVREGYGIEGDCCTDIILGGFLPCCAAMRLHAEINSRGPIKKGMH